MWIELQRLVFDFGKKVPAMAGSFLCLFARVFEGVFENFRFWCGVFVVRMWWICGELWLGGDCSVVG
jgi:hypothetical protein